MELVEITSNQDQDEGWQDLIFSVVDKKKESNGYWNLVCKGIHSDMIAGFRIYILNAIEPGIVDNDLDNSKFVNAGIKIESIGNESDYFLEVISILYGEPVEGKFIESVNSYTVFPLNQTIGNLEEGYFKFKLFFDENNESGLYSEFYINIDLSEGVLEFNEKSEEYRRNIVSHLMK